MPELCGRRYRRAELLRRIEIRCVDKGYLAIVLSSRGDAQLEARSIETLLSLKIAGATTNTRSRCPCLA